MSIQKIDIKINDDKKFGLVAYLVDKDDFLKDVIEIRNRLHIKVPYILPDLPYEEISYVIEAFRKNQITISQVRTFLQEFCISNGLSLSDLDKTLASTSVFVEALMKKYQKKPIYFPVILASILMGYIQEYDFLSTYVVHLDSNNINQFINGNQLLSELDSENKLTAIVVTPESTVDEIEHTFLWLQKYQFGTKKTKKNDRMAEIMKATMEEYIFHGRKTSVKTVRKWYWERKGGKWPIDISLDSLHIEKAYYKQLLKDKYENKHILDSINFKTSNIKQALKRYKKALNK